MYKRLFENLERRGISPAVSANLKRISMRWIGEKR